MKRKKPSIIFLSVVIVLSFILSACSSNKIDTTNNTAQQNDVVQSTDIQQENNSESNNLSLEKKEKTEEFQKKAEEIEKYSKENYETATTQSQLNTESYNVYVKWDSLLNEVYQYLKATMSSEDFASLEADEIEWIKDKEKGIAEAAAEWEGGSGEPMARNSAGAKYTKERCYYLISLIK